MNTCENCKYEEKIKDMCSVINAHSKAIKQLNILITKMTNNEFCDEEKDAASVITQDVKDFLGIFGKNK